MNTRQTPLSVICEDRPEGIAHHRVAWNALAQQAPFGEWWAGPDWIMPWLEAYGGNTTWAIHFVYEADRLRGVVPLIVSPKGARGIARFTLPVNSHVRRVGWLADDPVLILAAVLRDVRRKHPAAAVALPQIPRDSTWSMALQVAAERAGFQRLHTPQTSSAVAEFADGWSAYVDSRDSKLLRNLRRHWKRLDAANGWRVELCEDVAGLSQAWQAVLSVESRSWKHANSSSIDAEPGAAQLYEQVASCTVQRGALRLWTLWQHDLPVAHALSVLDRGTLYLLKNSYDETFRSSSPGVALVWHAMEAAAAEGSARVDFLGDAAAWKRPFATTLPAYESWLLFPAWHLGAQWLRALEYAIKPPIRALRAWRRHRSPAGTATTATS